MHRSTKRLLNIIVCVSILLITLGTSVQNSLAEPTNPAGLSMEATPAFNGHFKYGEWLPIWVEIENLGMDIDGELGVRVSSPGVTNFFATSVHLPTNSHKRIPLYVLPNSFSRSLVVQLVADEEVLATHDVKVSPKPNMNYVVGIVAEQPGALNLITGIQLRERQITIVNVSPDSLPEKMNPYLSFDLLIFNDIDTSGFTKGQSKALSDWVSQGGQLILGGGANTLKTFSGFPEEILPFLPKDIVELNTMEAFASFADTEAIELSKPFVAAGGDVLKGIVALEQDNIPLLINMPFNNGLVQFINADLSASPFDRWAGTIQFWSAIVGEDAEFTGYYPDMSKRQIRSNSLGYQLSNIPSLDLPSVKNLSLLLGIYILLVGPINYFILRWKKKLMWGWVTIPVLTLAFAASTFGVSYSMRGTDLVVNKIGIIQLLGNGSAEVNSFVGLFSPTQESYQIDILDDGLISPMSVEYYDQMRNFGAQDTQAPTVNDVVFVQGPPSSVRGLSVNQWSMQSFMLENMVDDFGTIFSDLNLINGNVEGTITNNLGRDLLDTAVILGIDYVKLGDIKAGETVEVLLPRADFSKGSMGHMSVGWRMMEDSMRGNISPQEQRTNEVKANILDQVFSPGYATKIDRDLMVELSMSSLSSNIGVDLMFIGWTNEIPPIVSIDGKELIQKSTGLVYTTIPYQIRANAEGKYYIPAGLIPGQISKMPPNGGYCDIGALSVYMDNSRTEYEFTIPQLEEGLELTSLLIGFGSDGGAWGLPKIEIYDWEQGNMQELDNPVMGVSVLHEPASFISEENKVQLSMSNQGMNIGGCMNLSLGLEAEK